MLLRAESRGFAEHCPPDLLRFAQAAFRLALAEIFPFEAIPFGRLGVKLTLNLLEAQALKRRFCLELMWRVKHPMAVAMLRIENAGFAKGLRPGALAGILHGILGIAIRSNQMTGTSGSPSRSRLSKSRSAACKRISISSGLSSSSFTASARSIGIALRPIQSSVCGKTGSISRRARRVSPDVTSSEDMFPGPGLRAVVQRV